MCGPFHGKTRQQHDAARRLVTRTLCRTLIARLFLPRATQPSLILGQEVAVVDATRCHRLVLQKVVVGRFVVCLTGCTRLCSVPALRPVDRGRVPSYRCYKLFLQGVGRFVVLFFTCQMSSRLFFCNSLRFLLFSWSGTVASGREGSAAEPDVAWLASEAMATLCAERLKPLRQRSDSHEQPCAKTCRSVL